MCKGRVIRISVRFNVWNSLVLNLQYGSLIQCMSSQSLNVDHDKCTELEKHDVAPRMVSQESFRDRVPD